MLPISLKILKLIANARKMRQSYILNEHSKEFGAILNREEAVAVSKEAITLLQNQGVTSIKLTEPVNDSASGLKLIIQALFDNQATSEINKLCQRRGLSIKFLNDEAVIY